MAQSKTISAAGGSSGGKLSPYLSPMAVWALSLGTAIGWGSLVVTSNSYLLQAGPAGSILGLLIGAAIMLVVGRNYYYLINCFPDSGGAYTYAKEVFGHDFGFLTSWFVTLTYIAIFWANASSLPLFAHYFLGDIFRFGYLYTVFGYEVYIGEALLTVAAIALFAAICSFSRKGVMHATVILALIICAGITICFIAALFGFIGTTESFSPAFLPDSSAFGQILLITCISPWAFIGFEGISHSAEEYAFPRAKLFRIMVAAVVCATLLYVFLLLTSVMAYPPEYSSWLAYLSDLGNLTGLEALPPFYAAYRYLGDAGVVMLMVVLLALVATSLVGNTLALTRLWHALARDGVFPKQLAHVNSHGTPSRAILLMAGVSFFIPLLGRTAIGWIVDVTTIGATIVYGLVSAAASRMARSRGDSTERVTGAIGVACMIGFGAFLLLPVLFGAQTLEAESYFLFATWGIIGFAFFRVILARDHQRRFGRSTIVWIALLSLVMVATFVWMSQALLEVEKGMVGEVVPYIEGSFDPATQDVVVEGIFSDMLHTSSVIMVVAALMLALACIMLLTNFNYMSKRVEESEQELSDTREVAYTDPITGLPSLARFRSLATERAAQETAAGHKPAAIVLYLVGLKDLKSRYGRDESYRVLRLLASVLKKCFGDDACACVAENRFYVIAAEQDVEAKIADVFAAMENGDVEHTLPVRAGAYAFLEGEDVTAGGFDRASAACELDQRTWQSSFSWYSERLDDEARLRLHVLDKLDQAIEERWIRPFYQQVVRADNGAVCHEEALARWIDPEYGFLSPGQFIPTLEGAGLLHKVDLHILDCVLDDFDRKREFGLPIVPVSVNISLRDLGQLDIAEEILSRVDAAGVSHDLVVIEFTESAASDNPESFKLALNKLRAGGLEVWMDDFGSGYSSLNVLKEYEFDVVKLDMDFMRGEGDARRWNIVNGVVQMAKGLDMDVLAEGVETAEQAQHLHEASCDMLQGFYFAKPCSLEDLARAYREGEGLPSDDSR